MTDPDSVLAVTAAIGGRKRRLTTAKQLRTAISQFDIDRETEVLIEDELLGERTCRADEHPFLESLFTEILGSPASASDRLAGSTADTVKPSEVGFPPARLEPAAKAVEPMRIDRGAAFLPFDQGLQPGDLTEIHPVTLPLDEESENRGRSSKLPALVFAGIAVMGLIWLTDNGGETTPTGTTNAVIEPRASVPSTTASFAPIASATTDETPSPSENALMLELERERQMALKRSREKERLALKRVEARRTAAPLPQLTVAPNPAPRRTSLAKRAAPLGQSSWGRQIARNYPARALNQGVEGQVRLSVVVGPDGRAQSCAVTGTSGSPILDRAACDGMLRHARFEPALDDDGNPTQGSYATSIMYQLSE
jgi:TonB family protein